MVIKKLRLLLFSGTKQRCPLIPLLFNIVLDSLCSLMSDLRTQISLQIVTSNLGKYYEWLMIQYNTCHQKEAGHLSVLEIKKYTENIWNIRTGFKNNKNYSVYHLLLTEVLGCPVTKNLTDISDITCCPPINDTTCFLTSLSTTLKPVK